MSPPLPAPLPSASPPLIPEWFAGREVFITGGTGFMGKVLIERLLWTCPDVSRLHLLIRDKKEVAPERRLQELKQSQVFDVIRKKCPHQLDKLCIVAGDVSKPRLGIDGDTLQQLKQVSVVFHSAATTKFDEPLDVAVEQNLTSVIKLMNICDELPNMQVLIHISTAYSNAELSYIEERVYPQPTSLEQLLAIADNVPQDLLADITARLISPKPNTYTFTKAMAESAVSERASTAPYAIAIFRPSIVASSLQHPFPGWIDNLNGPCGVIAGLGKGMLHVLNCCGEKKPDMIPVDVVIDTLIGVAWETGVDNTRVPRVYNCCTNNNSSTLYEFKRNVLRAVREHPFDSVLYYPCGLYTKSRLVMIIFGFLLHTVPLYTVGFLYNLCGVRLRPSLPTVAHRLRTMNDALKFFALREWTFSTENVRRLKKRLAPTDADIFNIDPNINWRDHSMDFVKGVRKYLLQESDKNLPKAQFRMKVLHFVHLIMQFLLAYVILYLVKWIVFFILRILEIYNPLD